VRKAPRHCRPRLSRAEDRAGEPGTHRTPGRGKPPVLAGLALTWLQGRGPGQVGTVARRSDIELGPQFGHADDISTLRTPATF
jgi:hypothetical protein